MPHIVSHIVDVYVYRVIDAQPAFLVLRRAPASPMPHTWQAVHGHIEPGETAFQAAARELAEETGLTAVEWHQLGSVNTFFLAATDEIHLCAGFAARVGPRANAVLNEEHDDHVWLAPAAACDRFHWPGQRKAVREVCELILAGEPAADALRIPPP